MILKLFWFTTEFCTIHGSSCCPLRSIEILKIKFPSLPWVPRAETVTSRLPRCFKGGIGPMKTNPRKIMKFPTMIECRPSKPLSIKNPITGVKRVYAMPKAMNTRPVWEALILYWCFRKGSKEAEYQLHPAPAKTRAKMLTPTPDLILFLFLF